MKRIFMLLALLFCIQALAQEKSTEKDYAKNPLWIAMIDNPNTNYFEALKAYEIYFKANKMPEEPEELAHEKTKKGTQREVPPSRNLTKEELAQKEAEQELALQVKRFKRWKREVLPFVQEDGRILSADEQIKVWEEVSGKSRNGK